MKKEMLINVLQPEECRIAILEDGILEELYVERTSHESYVGNIYKGRIVNIEPSIQAAFVDFGVGRNGFLHVSDVEPAYYRHLEQGRGEGRRPIGRDRHRGSAHRGPRPAPVEAAPGARDAEDEELWEPTPAAEAPPTEETPEALASAAGEAPPAEEPETGGERKRSRRGSRRRRGPGRRREAEATSATGAEGPTAPTESAESPHASAGDAEPPKPRLMESAERRTDEEQPGSEPAASSLSDDDLFFPRSEPAAHEARREVPEEPAAHEEAREVPEELAAPAEAFELADEENFEPAEGPETTYSELAVEGLDEDVSEADFGDDFGDERVPALDEEGEYDQPRRPRQHEGGRRGRFVRRGPPGRPGSGRPKPLIQDIFKRGQEVLVQVIKEGIGTKGPTLSTYISIAGRYLVLMPGLNRIGVSRKIQDDEQRRRLRDVLSELQPPKGIGFIIRTAGMDRNKKELQRDLAYLSRLWQVVVRRIRKLKAPAEIYQESDMITRTIRDTFTNEIESIWVDEPAAFEHAQEFLQIVMPRYAARIKLYDQTEPLFHKHGIEDEIVRIQQRHVPLPNGGSIVIEQTEALVAIDVNSGNFRADGNAEETAYQMNLHAAKEIARQLRLRDLGGVIVNDFIDMRDEKHRRGVEKAVRDAMKRDRARTKILRISQFGIIEMTRQRIRPSLKRSVYQDCPHCMGTGQVKTCESMSIDVMRLLQLAAHQSHVHHVQVRVAEEVANYLLNKKRKEMTTLEEAGNIQVQVTGVTAAPPELLEFGCYDNNNNEVKLMPYDDRRPRPR